MKLPVKIKWSSYSLSYEVSQVILLVWFMPEGGHNIYWRVFSVMPKKKTNNKQNPNVLLMLLWEHKKDKLDYK